MEKEIDIHIYFIKKESKHSATTLNKIFYISLIIYGSTTENNTFNILNEG